MELSELKSRIIEAFTGSSSDLEQVLQLVDEDKSIFPFNEYEHLICNLINRGGLKYSQYIDIRSDYMRENPNLWIYEISAPRGFGEGFAQSHVQNKSKKLKKHTRSTIKNTLDNMTFGLME